MPKERRKKEGRHDPRQDRSKELVRAVREAGRLLLEELGPEGLTTTRIAERAGVSVGSLYRYFENKEAILEAIHGEVAEELRSSLGELAEKLRGMEPVERLRLGIEYSVTRHLRMLELDPSYYREHHEEFRMSAGLAASTSGPELAAVSFSRELLERESKLRPDVDLDHAAFLLGRGVSAILRAALEDRPELLREPGFGEELVRMMTRYLFPDEPPASND